MRKSLLLGATALLCALLVAPAAYAHRDTDDDWDHRPSHRHHHDHRSDAYHDIQRKRAKLDRAYEERRQALWIHDKARRMGDWATVRFERARLDRLDRKIAHGQRELRHAYQKLKWRRDRHDRDDGRDRYGYQYDRF